MIEDPNSTLFWAIICYFCGVGPLKFSGLISVLVKLITALSCSQECSEDAHFAVSESLTGHRLLSSVFHLSSGTAVCGRFQLLHHLLLHSPSVCASVVPDGRGGEHCLNISPSVSTRISWVEICRKETKAYGSLHFTLVHGSLSTCVETNEFFLYVHYFVNWFLLLSFSFNNHCSWKTSSLLRGAAGRQYNPINHFLWLSLCSVLVSCMWVELGLSLWEV